MVAPFSRGLYAIVDLHALGIRDPVTFAAEVLAGGAVAIQLRAKTAPAASERSVLPIVAIGGIGPRAAREIAVLGAHAVAVIDALARTQDPRAVAAAFGEAFA